MINLAISALPSLELIKYPLNTLMLANLIIPHFHILFNFFFDWHAPFDMNEYIIKQFRWQGKYHLSEWFKLFHMSHNHLSKDQLDRVHYSYLTFPFDYLMLKCREIVPEFFLSFDLSVIELLLPQTIVLLSNYILDLPKIGCSKILFQSHHSILTL